MSGTETNNPNLIHMLATILLIICVVALMAAICARRWRLWALRLDEERLLREKERQQVLGFMHDFVTAVGDGVRREDLLRLVTNSALVSTGALSACIFELKGRELVAAAVDGLFPPQMPLPRGTNYRIATRARFIEGVLRSERIPVGQGIIGAVAQSGESIFLPDAESDERVVHMDDPALVLHSLIAVPIRFRKHMIAVLAVANTSSGAPFTSDSLSLMTGIAEQAGLAIHNLELIEAQKAKNKMDVDLALASSIQTMLLPRSMPQSESLDIAALYLPAQKVGGDLYDVFQIGETRYGVAVADVSGKGVPASLLMAICQSNLRHLARSGITPARVLSDLNAIMREEMRRDMFVTMIYAIIDTAEGLVTLARAGHELPVMLRRGVDGELKPEFIDSEGMALGMVPERLFDKAIQERSFPFGKDEILVLYTDGITETVDRTGVQFGSARLADAVLELRDGSARNLNERIFDRVRLFSDGAGQGDDVTMLTIKHK